MRARSPLWHVLAPLLVAPLFASAGCSGADATQERAGYYVFGHEVRTIRFCGTDEVLWVQGPTEVLRSLRERHEELTERPYDSIFVSVRGMPVDTTTAAFAEQYDGVFDITELLEARGPGPDDC